MREFPWVPVRLEFTLETNLNGCWLQIQSYLESREESFIYEDTLYCVAARQKVLSATKRRIILDGVVFTPGFLKRPRKRPEVIVFDLSLVASDKTFVTAQLNLREDRLENCFLSLLISLAGPVMDSEAAQAIAKAYPPDPLPPNMTAIAVVKTDLAQFMALLNRFAARYEAENPVITNISIREKPRNFDSPWRIEKRLVSYEPLVLYMDIIFEKIFFHPTWRVRLPSPVYDPFKIFLFPLADRIELWIEPLDDEINSEYSKAFLSTFVTYLHSLGLILEGRALAVPNVMSSTDPVVTPPPQAIRAEAPHAPKKSGGRKRFRENDWAFIELQIKERFEDKVRQEWIALRNQLKRPRLDNIFASFEKAIANANRLPTSEPEAGWAWTKIHSLNENQDAVYIEWREICQKLGRAAYSLSRDIFEEHTKK